MYTRFSNRIHTIYIPSVYLRYFDQGLTLEPRLASNPASSCLSFPMLGLWVCASQSSGVKLVWVCMWATHAHICMETRGRCQMSLSIALSRCVSILLSPPLLLYPCLSLLFSPCVSLYSSPPVSLSIFFSQCLSLLLSPVYLSLLLSLCLSLLLCPCLSLLLSLYPCDAGSLKYWVRLANQ